MATVLLLGLARPAAAQEALVLSTGASRGLAHAGVVAGMEEKGHDPELVVGSSMGAVIGGLYAAGYGPDEIRVLLEDADWADIFKPMPLLLGPDRVARLPVIRVGVALTTLEVDRGFTPDWRLNRLLTRFFFDAGVRSRGDFDRLARRYRPVAADLETGEEVVLAEGDLARAVRASMGTPGFFSPVEWNGRLLTDGGVANYLPISVARDLGARTVVAADVSRPPPWVEAKNPVALAARGIGLLMRNALPDTLPDILIRPRLDPNMPGVAFPDDPTPLIALGYEATLDALPPGPGRAGDRSLPPPPSSFSGLVVETPDPRLRALARRVFEDAASGGYDPERVFQAVDRLYATGLVAGVWPRLEADGDGAPPGGPRLVVRLDPVPRTFLAAALGYENDRGGRGWVELQRRAGLGSAPVEVMLAGTVDGLDRWVESSARLHLPATVPFAWSVGLHARETDVRVFDADPATGDAEVWRAGGSVGVEYRRIFPDRIALLTVHAEHVDEGERSGLSAGPRFYLSTAAAPTQMVGLPMELEAGLRLGEIGYAHASFRGSIDTRWRGFRGSAVVDLAVTEKDAPLDVRPALGDDHAVPGFAWGEERGRARAVVGLDLAHPIFLGGAARLRLRMGAAPDALGDFEREDSWVGGAALEGVWTAPFGPIVVGVGANTRGGQRLDVSLGPTF